MKNLITDQEADGLRAFVSGERRSDISARVFMPIGMTAATGRAACRRCGTKIPEGEQVISFGFDSRAGQAKWGHLAQSVLHVRCPEGGDDGESAA